MVSMYEATHGYAAKTTAARDAKGNIVGNSIGSNYVRQQEAEAAAKKQQAVQQQQTPVYSQVYQQQNQILQSQIQAVEAERPKESVVQSSFKERTIQALNEGYKAGQGVEYSLSGLKAPTTNAKDMLSYSLAEKANLLATRIDETQNRLLGGLPSGHIKDLFSGVTNIPEMAVSAAGNLPLGLESIARNPTSVSDSISFGLGSMAGATVHKAKTHPAELAGEIIGSVTLAKAGSSLESSTYRSLSKDRIREFYLDDSATLGKTKSPSQTLVYRPKPQTEEIKIPTYVFSHGRLYPESKVPKLTALDISETGTKLKGLRGSASARSSAKMRTSVGKYKEPVQIEIEKITPKQELETVELAETQKPKLLQMGKQETVLRSRESMQELDVLLQEQKLTEIPEIRLISEQKLKPKSQAIALPSFALALPFAAQAFNLASPQQQKAIPDLLEVPNLLQVSRLADTSLQVPTVKAVPSQKQHQKTSPIQVPDIIPVSPVTPVVIPDINPFDTPSPKPSVDPFYNPPAGPTPKPSVDPFYNPPIDPIITSIEIPKIVFGGGLDFTSLSLPHQSTPRKKTKHKTIKNIFGDPFSQKTIF